jgi:hypothetical protein
LLHKVREFEAQALALMQAEGIAEPARLRLLEPAINVEPVPAGPDGEPGTEV